MLVGGNWKCNGTLGEVAKWCKMFNEGGPIPISTEVFAAPAACHIGYVTANLRPDIAVSAQNCGVEPKPGAFTGEMCASMLADVGCKWVVLGHSERRHGYHGETSAQVATKTAQAVEAGLKACVCVGETLEERESGKMLDVILGDHVRVSRAALAVRSEKRRALTIDPSRLLPQMAALLTLPEAAWAKIAIAYEPVWAIGTGKVASPAQAQEVHAEIRKWVAEKVSPEVAGLLRIQYGGSVKASNAKELAACPDIDGFLIGGASLKPDFIDCWNAFEG